MAKKYLDDNGLLYFWQKIKNTFALKSEAVSKTTTTPKAPGTAAIGSETKYAAGDHVHPLQTTVSGNAGTATTLQTARYIDGAVFNGSANIVHYGVCSTAAGTAAKTVTINGVDGFSTTPAAGMVIHVKFNNTNSAANPTLSVNGGTALPIRYRGASIYEPSNTILRAVDLLTFICVDYSGSLCWELVGSPGDFRSYYGVCQTAAATATKVVTILNASYDAGSSGQRPERGMIVYIQATADNTVISGLKLNVNGTGEYFVIVEGNTVQENDARLAWKAGEVTGYMFEDLNGISTGSSSTFYGVWRKISGSGGVPGTTTPKALGTAAVGTSIKYAREDHVHPSIAAASTSAAGLMSAADKTKLNKLVFDSNNLIDSSILPSYVDDVIEAYARSGQTALSSTWLATGSASGTVITPEAGKIYVLMATSGDYAANTQFRWGGSAYVKLNDGGVTEITNAEIDTIVAS